MIKAEDQILPGQSYTSADFRMPEKWEGSNVSEPSAELPRDCRAAVKNVIKGGFYSEKA